MGEKNFMKKKKKDFIGPYNKTLGKKCIFYGPIKKYKDNKIYFGK